MPLPPALRWIEVDLPPVIDYKSHLLASEKPACRVERVRADLTRDALPVATRAVVVTEGVIAYLSNAEASKLSRDLFASAGVEYWIQDYRRGRLNRRAEAKLGAPFRFDVLEPLEYFARDGWSLRENIGILDVADSVRRHAPLPFPWNAVRAVMPAFVRRKGNATYGYAMFGRPDVTR
jgi:O-methyltransferase involved in polyketide biosynthesis